MVKYAIYLDNKLWYNDCINNFILNLSDKNNMKTDYKYMLRYIYKSLQYFNSDINKNNKAVNIDINSKNVLINEFFEIVNGNVIINKKPDYKDNIDYKQIYNEISNLKYNDNMYCFFLDFLVRNNDMRITELINFKPKHLLLHNFKYNNTEYDNTIFSINDYNISKKLFNDFFIMNIDDYYKFKYIYVNDNNLEIDMIIYIKFDKNVTLSDIIKYNSYIYKYTSHYLEKIIFKKICIKNYGRSYKYDPNVNVKYVNYIDITDNNLNYFINTYEEKIYNKIKKNNDITLQTILFEAVNQYIVLLKEKGVSIMLNKSNKTIYNRNVDYISKLYKKTEVVKHVDNDIIINYINTDNQI